MKKWLGLGMLVLCAFTSGRAEAESRDRQLSNGVVVRKMKVGDQVYTEARVGTKVFYNLRTPSKVVRGVKKPGAPFLEVHRTAEGKTSLHTPSLTVTDKSGVPFNSRALGRSLKD